jgi:hypothetical protein
MLDNGTRRRYKVDQGHVVVDSIETMRRADITHDLARELGIRQRR